MSANWADQASQKILAEADVQRRTAETNAALREHLCSEAPIYWEALQREMWRNIRALNDRQPKPYLDTFLFPVAIVHDLTTSSIKGSLRILFSPNVPVVFYEFTKAADSTPQEPTPRVPLYFVVDEGRVRLTREDGTPLRPPAMADYLLNKIL